MTDSRQTPIVALVGRPNVGKSTLFNRLVGSRRAIIDDVPGTTRDRLYADAEWQGRIFTFVDTGGLGDEGELAEAVTAQVHEAIAEADLILFVVDATAGVVAGDRPIADLLRKSGRDVRVIANKADNLTAAKQAADFWDLGLGEPLPVSAQHGRGTGDLLDLLLPITTAQTAPERPDVPHVALVGRPNVGKSTLFNQLAETAQRITSDRPHTTRDTGTVDVQTPDGPVVLFDTAGVQRRGKSGRGIPKFSLLRTLRAVHESDVVCLMVDATEGPTMQDAHIAAYVVEAGKAVVLVVNKWDLAEKTPDIQERFLGQLEDKLGFLPAPPVVFVSALTGEKISRIGRAVYDVYKLAATEVPTAELNRIVQEQLTGQAGGAGRRSARLYYLTQVGTRPPTFLCFVNKVEQWKPNHRKHLENLIRERFGLLGTPVRLKFRLRSSKERVS